MRESGELMADQALMHRRRLPVDDAIEIAEKIEIWRIGAISSSADMVGGGQIVVAQSPPVYAG